MKMIDLTGKRFGRLTVIKRGENVVNRPGWVCRCDCGKVILVAGGHLRDGHTQSCGCRQIDSVTKRNTTHSLSNTKLYGTWCNMRDRCSNPNSTYYNHYGGRGISVCDEWKRNFQAFFDWAISNGYKDGLTIDRIDVNGNYEPCNCRWATRLEQANNTRFNHKLTLNGKTQTLAQWSRELGIRYDILSGRASKGWSDEEVLTTPVKQR